MTPGTPSSRTRSGYTLVELAIVIAVTGLVLQGGAMAWRVYAQNKAVETTAQHLNEVTNALDSYLAQTGHYPCPARLDTPRTESGDYGMAIQCDSSAAGYEGPANPGDYADGIYAQAATLPDGTVVRVYRGMVPFRLLNLLEEKAYDGHHTRLQYVVTERLTSAQNYADTGGVIEIIDDTTDANPLFGVATGNPGARYLVFSTGPDKKGAWNRDGRRILPCDNPSATGAAKDALNCWNTPAATYKSGAVAETDGADHFDDSLKYYSSNTSIIWKARSADGAVISDNLDAQNNTGGVIGIGNAPSKYAVEVIGAARAQNSLYLSRLCNAGNYASWGGNCFLPQKISIGAGTGTVAGSAATYPEMQCPNPWWPGTYVNAIQGDNQRGVTEGAMICTNLVAPAVCPSGEYIYAIQNGKILCSPLNPPCPEMEVTVCAGQSPVIIPASDSGDPTLRLSSSINTSGWISNGQSYIDIEPNALWFRARGNDLTLGKEDDYTRENWHQCIGGNWLYRGYVGRCSTCDPIELQHHPIAGEEPIPCSTWFEGGGGENDTPYQDTWGVSATYTGHVSQWDFYRTCSAGGNNQDHWLNIANDCVCQNTTIGDTFDCYWRYGEGWSGTITTHCEWTCENDLWGRWNCDPDIENCVYGCEPREDRTTNPPCPPGYGGTRTVTESWDCALNDGAGDWVVVSTTNNCVCQPGTDGPYPTPCQPGYTGMATRMRTIDCDSGSPVFSEWAYNYDGCTCDPTGTEQVTVTACQNDPGYGAGYVGNIVTTTTFNCTAEPPTWNPPVTTNDCQVGGYTWSSGGTPSPQPQKTNPGYPMVGSVCTTQGASGYYCQKLQAGGYITYPSCTCN